MAPETLESVLVGAIVAIAVFCLMVVIVKLFAMPEKRRKR
jgi:uncharacterized protein (DUF2062 family)